MINIAHNIARGTINLITVVLCSVPHLIYTWFLAVILITGLEYNGFYPEVTFVFKYLIVIPTVVWHLYRIFKNGKARWDSYYTTRVTLVK